jgi:hypothetical protein
MKRIDMSELHSTGRQLGGTFAHMPLGLLHTLGPRAVNRPCICSLFWRASREALCFGQPLLLYNEWQNRRAIDGAWQVVGSLRRLLEAM